MMALLDPVSRPAAVPGPLGSGVQQVHMIGIGGAGMEPLARLLRQSGYRVTGSDAGRGVAVDDLRHEGIVVFHGHEAANIGGADLIVHSAAVAADNCERLAASAAGIPQRRRAEVLGDLSRAWPTVAVAGTHGKTTTSSLVAAAAIACGREPAVAIGGWVGGRTQATRGGGDLLVAEADEYDRSFLELTSWIPVVTNIEAEHLDCYADEAAVVAAFGAFLSATRSDGTVIINGDDPRCAQAAAAVDRPVLRFGRSAACEVRAEDSEIVGAGTRFQVVAEGRRRAITLRLAGEHNVANALAAWSAVLCLGLDQDAAAAAFEAFAGVDRRFQVRVTGGITVVDDYAHHPTELAATLATARERAGSGRVVTVFQPHTYSRTRHFADDFARALAGADESWITAVYAARETPASGAEGKVIADALARAGGRGHWEPDADAALAAALESCRPGDWLVAMGAGDIGARLSRRLSNSAEEQGT